MDFTDVTGCVSVLCNIPCYLFVLDRKPFCGLKSHMFQPEACEFVCGVSLCPA